MAVKSLFNKEPDKKPNKTVRAKDSGMKPLAKAYISENPDQEGKSFFVFQARLTPKGFLLLMCKDFTLMYPGATEEASSLLDDIFPKLHGKKAHRLCAVLSKANRFGAYLAVDDEHSCYYSFDAQQEVLLTSVDPIVVSEEAKGRKLTLEDFGTLT